MGRGRGVICSRDGFICSTISPSTTATFHSSLLPCFTTVEPVCKLIVGHGVCLSPQPWQGFIFFLRKKLLLLPASICSILKPFHLLTPLPPRYHFCMSVQQLPCTHGVPKASGGLWAQQTPSAELWPAGLCWWAAASALPEPWAGNAGTPAPLRSSVTFIKYKVPLRCGSHRAARGRWRCCSASDGAVFRGMSFAFWMWLS